MSVQDWHKCLIFGKLGEEKAKEKVHHFLLSVLKQYEYGLTKENTLKQRQGIDFSLNLKELTFDVKTRKFKYYVYKDLENDIALETISAVEDNVKGWLYTSKSDVIFYIWLTEDKTKIFDGVILVLSEVRNFVKDYEKTHTVRYKKSSTLNKSSRRFYHTEFMLIPVCDFPSNALIYCNVDKLDGICCIN